MRCFYIVKSKLQKWISSNDIYHWYLDSLSMWTIIKLQQSYFAHIPVCIPRTKCLSSWEVSSCLLLGEIPWLSRDCLHPGMNRTFWPPIDDQPPPGCRVQLERGPLAPSQPLLIFARSSWRRRDRCHVSEQAAPKKIREKYQC